MLKSYEELRRLDVRRYCERRDGFYYLNWAKCIDLLRANGAQKAYFEPVPNPKTGGSLYESDTVFTDKNGVTNRCYETRIRIVIDDNEFYMQSPVMNGTNPVKDNSMNQLRVWTSMCRSFVKGVAIYTGLGYSLWLDEEDDCFREVPDTEADKHVSDMRLKVLKDACKRHKIDFDAWLQRVNLTEDVLTEEQASKMLVAIQNKYGDQTVEDTEEEKGKKK